MPKRREISGEAADWELEHQFDIATTLQDLIDAPPFREVSSDTGESQTAGTRIPIWMYRRLNKLKEFKGSPYEVISDVLRDAIHIGLRVLSLRYKIDPDWRTESRMASIVDEAGNLRRLRRQVEDLIESLADLWKGEDYEPAITSLSAYVHTAAEMDNHTHRRKVFATLRSSKVVQEILTRCDEDVRSVVDKEAK